MIVSVMVDMEFLSAFTVTYASRLAGGGPIEQGSPRELSEESPASRGAGASIADTLSLLARARVASLTTIFHQSLPHRGRQIYFKTFPYVAWHDVR